MKPALHSWSLREKFKSDPHFDIFQALTLAGEMGFTAMEIMAGKADSPPDHAGPAELTHLSRVVEAARSLGIEITCWSTYNDFAYVRDETWRQANIAFIKRWCSLAADTGVPNLRLLTGYLVPNEDPLRLEELVYEGIVACVAVAEQCDVNLALENHSSVFMSAESILRLIMRVGSNRLTTCPDPSNWEPRFFEADCPPAAREAVYRQLDLLAPLATQAHLKIKGVEAAGGIVGFDLDRLTGIFHRHGYGEAIALESIAREDLLAPLPAARQALEAAIARLPNRRTVLH